YDRDDAATLGLEPHPEGGWYRETFREPASSAIYYLLKAGERSHWHRVDAGSRNVSRYQPPSGWGSSPRVAVMSSGPAMGPVSSWPP
ncbi:MAG TPA: cupin domain-containing protein, partial [Acidimicrobiales bacterium]|nr:cupin domain-containing protein [Acidimicrobiales bacterium]